MRTPPPLGPPLRRKGGRRIGSKFDYFTAAIPHHSFSFISKTDGDKLTVDDVGNIGPCVVVIN